MALLAILCALLLVPSAHAYTHIAADQTKTDSLANSYAGRTASMPFGLPTVAPTRFRLMPTRFVLAKQAVAGYERSGVSLVGFNGTTFTPAGESDDLGLYYLVPKIAAILHSSTERTIDVLIFAVIAFPLLVGIPGFYLLVRRRSYRLWGIVALCGVAAISACYGDVYVVQAGIVIAFVPWILYLARGGVRYAFFMVFSFTVGLACTAANILRFHAGTPVMAFAVIVLLSQVKTKLSSRISLIVALAIGALTPHFYFHSVLENRDRFLLAEERNYVPAVPYHPTWHNIYTGLGFLNNVYGLKNTDESAIEKVRTIDPDAPYPSAAYERIARNEVFRTFKAHPGFVLYSLAAKLGLLLLVVAICSGPGLIAAARCPKPWPIECAFWSAAFIASLNGVLVEPRAAYLLGLVALCVLYGIVSLEWKSKSAAGQAGGKYESVSLSLDGVPPSELTRTVMNTWS